MADRRAVLTRSITVRRVSTGWMTETPSSVAFDDPVHGGIALHRGHDQAEVGFRRRRAAAGAEGEGRAVLAQRGDGGVEFPSRALNSSTASPGPRRSTVPTWCAWPSAAGMVAPSARSAVVWRRGGGHGRDHSSWPGPPSRVRPRARPAGWRRPWPCGPGPGARRLRRLAPPGGHAGADPRRSRRPAPPTHPCGAIPGAWRRGADAKAWPGGAIPVRRGAARAPEAC